MFLVLMPSSRCLMWTKSHLQEAVMTDTPKLKKSLLCSIGVWCFMFGHSLLPVPSWVKPLLGGAEYATVVVYSSMPTYAVLPRPV